METVKASIQVGDKLVVFEGPRDFVEAQVARFRFEVPGTAEQGAPEVGPQGKRRRRNASGRVTDLNATSCTGRILALRGEGLFGAQRTISEIRSELASRGWHYPLTTLSGRLQTLVQQRFLRRERVKDGRRKVWKYSNV